MASIPISIPGPRDDTMPPPPPPPLPPPRYMAEVSSVGDNGMAWKFTTSSSDKDNGAWGRPIPDYGSITSRRSQLAHQLELPHRGSSTIKTGAFQSSVHESYQTKAQAYDKPLLEKLDVRRGTDNTLRTSPFRPDTDDPYPTSMTAPRSPLSQWNEAGLRTLEIDDGSTRPPDSSASQKRRASSPPPQSNIFDPPHVTSSSFAPSLRGSVSMKNHYQPAPERYPLVTLRESASITLHSNLNNTPKISAIYICGCCPKKPKKFESQHELDAHEQEKQYECAYCRNRYKNKNEAERHEHSLHRRRHSWSCAALAGYSDAFHNSRTEPNEADTCGYCGKDFPRSGSGLGGSTATEQDWEVRIGHLQEMHKFGECNHAKTFFRADHFRQHLKHSHASISGKWTAMLENACMQDESLPKHLPKPKGPEKILELDEIDLESVDISQNVVDDADVGTCYSKDSGYSSMVSKTQRSIPDDDHGMSDSAKSETGSVASVQSWATRDTMSSVDPAAAGGAVEELAEMLLKDNLVSNLIVDGYKNFGSDRFERNFRRILKKFASSLRKNARNELEKSAIRLVRNYRVYIIILIRKRLELAEDRNAISLDELQKQQQSKLTLERFLELIPGAEEVGKEHQAEDNESGSDLDSDLSYSENPYLPVLERVKLYLTSSTAYSELKQQLTEFVRPFNTTKPFGGDVSLHTGLETGHDGVANVGKEYSVPQECSILDPMPNPKPEIDYPQFGSSSTLGVEFTWNVAFDKPQQNDKTESLQQYDLSSLLEPNSRDITNEQKSLEAASKIEYLQESVEHKRQLPKLLKDEVHLENWEPKHGWLEEALLSLKPWIAMSPKCTSRPLLTLHNWWARSRRKPVAKDHARIEWTCTCGHDLFADFNTKSLDILNKAAILKCTADGNSQGATSQPLTPTLASLPTAHLPHTISSNTPNQITRGLSNLMPAYALQTASVTANNDLDISFLELCVNTGPHLKSLAEIDTASISTDGTLFKALRKQYLRLRGFRSRFWLLKPAAISFVRFSLENRHRVGILQKPLALPPKSEVDAKKWIYDPCPLDGDPPIAEDVFLHYLQCSDGPNTLFWMLRFPRKLETSLLKSAAPASFGWGIHIDEGPDFAAIFKANFVVLAFSGIAAGLWCLLEHDFQGAFGFACWIIAVLNSLLLAYMFKWRQE